MEQAGRNRMSAGRADPHEEARLADLYALGILDTPPEPQLDRILALTAQFFGASHASISFIDRDRQWTKAKLGLVDWEIRRSQSICTITIGHPGGLVIPDSHRDRRVAALDAVCGAPHIRFYAGVPILSEHGRPVGTLCVMGQEPREFSEGDLATLRQYAALVESELRLRSALRDLGLLALTDDLTGLLNRRAFDKLLRQECQRAAESGAQVVVGMVDVDRFKAINDVHGHPAGDAALRFVAQRITGLLGEGEYLARLGGDEFSLLFTGPTSQARAEAVAHGLGGALAREGLPSVSVSLGLASSHLTVDPKYLLVRADQAMYRAKYAGVGYLFAELLS